MATLTVSAATCEAPEAAFARARALAKVLSDRVPGRLCAPMQVQYRPEGMVAKTEDPASRRGALAYALAAVCIWSTVATAFKLTLGLVAPSLLVAGAASVSALTLGLALAIQDRAAGLALCTPRDYLRAAGLGLLNPFLYYLILFTAYSRLLAQEALVLNYTWPIALVLLSIPLLGQRLPLRSGLALLVSFAGVVVIATRGRLSLGVSDVAGMALALGSSLIWALYWIGALRAPGKDLERMFLSFVFGTGYAWVGVLVAGPVAWPQPQAWIGVVYAGVFEMGLTFVIWLKALRLAGATVTVGNLVFLSPFISLLLIGLLLGEPLYPSSILGLALVVTGILLQRRSRPAG